MRIIKQSKRGITVSYSLDFGVWPTGSSKISLCAGFECDDKGNVFPLKHEAAKANLARCLAGLDGILPMGISERSHRWYNAAIGECINCARHVSLSGFTNTCECGADYNASGQALAHRSQWGEETGENASDILNFNNGEYND